MPSTNATVLSVVVPARNVDRWIGELLESVLAQGIDACEVIVVDNGSEDSTVDVVAEFAALDDRVVLVRSQAENAAAARNHGVSLATGEYLVFADSDDLVPDGAYRALLDALESSGSDMAFGDHLKFSPSSTWQPTARWGAFSETRLGISPSDAPALAATRPCWNRMFRRSWWDVSALRFPEVDSLEDMVSMTQSLRQARRIDVVAQCVYLYRDRGDGDSISSRSDSAATVRYLEQEALSLSLLGDVPELFDRLAGAVYDADGWAHLSRFLSRRPSREDLRAVREALRALLEVLPLDRLDEASVERRVLWDLVLADQWDAAVTYVCSTAAGSDPDQLLAGWSAVCSSLVSGAPASPGVVDNLRVGVLSALVNHAEAASDAAVATLLARSPESPETPGSATDSDLHRAMRTAVVLRDVERVRIVSSLRRVLPLVVHTARADPRGLSIEGASSDVALVAQLQLVLHGAGGDVVVPFRVIDGTWRAYLDATMLSEGRWQVSAALQNTADTFPVVTARMPLPPLASSFLLQPLSDRRDGWRFLVDRRRSRGRVPAILARTLKRLR